MKLITRILTIFLLVIIGGLNMQAVKPVKKRPFVLPAASTAVTVEANDALNSANIAAAITGKKAIMETVAKEESKNIVPDMINYARTHLGKRYAYGSPGPKSFDCSGFTSYVFRQFGYTLNRSSRDQWTQGVKVGSDEVQPGDLIFFGGRRGGKGVGHVGIITEVHPDGSMKFIHAATGGVQITNYPDGGYYSRRFIGTRRVLSDADRGE